MPGDDKNESDPQSCKKGENADVQQEVVQLVDVVGRVDVFDGQQTCWNGIMKGSSIHVFFCGIDST